MKVVARSWGIRTVDLQGAPQLPLQPVKQGALTLPRGRWHALPAREGTFRTLARSACQPMAAGV